MARPANPKPGDTTIQGGQSLRDSSGLSPGVDRTSSIDPHVAVFDRETYSVNDLYAYFENPLYVPADEKAMMLCDPQVNAALTIRRSALLIDGVQINPTEGVVEGTPAYEIAKANADLCRWALCNTSDSFFEMLRQLAAADWYCNLAADLIYRDQEWGTYKGKLLLDRMPVYGPGHYVIWHKDGRPIGLQPTAFKKSNPPKVYAIEKFALLRFRPGHECRNGTDLARIVRTPWYMKREMEPEQMALGTQFGRPSLWATAPEGVTAEVKLLGPDGRTPLLDKNGDVIMVPPQEALQEGLKYYTAGSTTVLPPTSTLNKIEVQSDGRFFNTLFDEKNWEIWTGILGTGNWTMRQKYGSNATAETGEDAVNVPIFGDKMALADLIKKCICEPMVRYNMPERNLEFIPTVTLGDPRQPIWDSIFKSIIANSPYADERLIGDLSRKVGVAAPDFERLRREGPLQGTVMPGGVGGNPQEQNA